MYSILYLNPLACMVTGYLGKPSLVEFQGYVDAHIHVLVCVPVEGVQVRQVHPVHAVPCTAGQAKQLVG